ncbi:hypothetical protein L9F63_019032, partial [Diploptera punctata]
SHAKCMVSHPHVHNVYEYISTLLCEGVAWRLRTNILPAACSTYTAASCRACVIFKCLHQKT